MESYDKIIARRTYEVHRFADVADLVDHVYNASPRVRFSFEPVLRRPDFTGRMFYSPADCKRAVFDVWDVGMNEFTRMRDDLRDSEVDKPVRVRRKPTLDEFDGDEIDVFRMRDGEPFFRQLSRNLLAGSRRVTIVVSLGANMNIDSHSIGWNGAVAAVVADMLEDAGYQVEVIAATASDMLYDAAYSPGGYVCGLRSFTVKSFGCPVDVSQLVNSLSGWFFRTTIFGSLHLSTKERKPNEFLGSVIDIHKGLLREVSSDPRAILIGRIETKSDAIKRAKEIIKSVNSGKLISKAEESMR